jgi:hypothetical protein
MRVVVSGATPCSATIGGRLERARCWRAWFAVLARATAVVAVSNGVADDLARWAPARRDRDHLQSSSTELLVSKPGRSAIWFQLTRRRSSSAPGAWDEPGLPDAVWAFARLRRRQRAW